MAQHDPPSAGKVRTSVALLFASIAVLDLRILGMRRQVPAEALAKILGPMAVSGFVLAVVAGPMLFVVQAKTYAALWLFQVKMVLLILALANAVWVLRSRSWREFRRRSMAGAGLKLGACLSLLLWFGVLVLGRLIGYA